MRFNDGLRSLCFRNLLKHPANFLYLLGANIGDYWLRRRWRSDRLAPNYFAGICHDLIVVRDSLSRSVGLDRLRVALDGWRLKTIRSRALPAAECLTALKRAYLPTNRNSVRRNLDSGACPSASNGCANPSRIGRGIYRQARIDNGCRGMDAGRGSHCPSEPSQRCLSLGFSNVSAI